jgi:hypothetical protein
VLGELDEHPISQLIDQRSHRKPLVGNGSGPFDPVDLLDSILPISESVLEALVSTAFWATEFELDLPQIGES